MKKLSSKNHSIHNFLITILLLGGGLFAAAGLASCENFLDGGDVKREIEDAIAYNNAKQLTVLLSAQEGTGSTLPSGNYTAKQGYDFEISFSENPAYSFVKWTAVSRTDSKTEITDGITFEDEKSPVTNVKITNLSDSIKIVPLCEKRIEVYGEPNPRYEPIGVSRDRSITVNFTKELAVENFFFDETEIPADAEEIKKDEEGKIWAYVYEGQTYLKNVSITNSDDYSIAEHFTCPVVEGKLLSIGVDKTNPIKFNVGENFKTVKVSLSKNITDTLGIKMNAEKSWNYQITESTDEKATVTLTSVAAEGSVYLAGTKDYSLGQKITLSFTEDADYQFVKWDYDSSIIFVAEPESANTIATVLDKTSGEDSTQIKAVCAPRLRVTEYSPVTDGATQTVCKNSSIVISFNHKLPTSEEDLAQLQNISITIGGAPVKSSFKAPVINEDTITFAADNSNMLDVPAGQKKTVSVTVPADFYYILEDGTKITYGGNGKSFDYKIDDTTLDKAEISFTAANGSGELTAASGTKKYSIGQEVPLIFVPADGWTFNGWSVMCGGQPVDESKIKIADVNALSTKLTVYEALTGVTVRAKTSECLEISETSPAAQINPKDSSIIIKFNKNLAEECASASMLNKIEISSDVKLDSYYTKRTLSGDTITIENTSPLSVPKGTTKVITVTVSSDFYYENEGNKINLTEKTFSFKVDYTTNAKAKVTYQIINGETDSAFSPADVAGTIEGLESAYQEYNIGEDAELSFALNSGYQFYGWKLTDADSANGLISNQVSFKDSSSKDLQPTLVFNKPINNLVVNVICYKRPVIISKWPYKSNSSDPFAKNESIKIEFDHEIEVGTENEIIVGYSISSFSKSTYYETSLSSTKDTIILNPIKMLPVEHTYETVTVTVPCAKVYYLAKDGKTKITPADDDYTWSFKVNNSTMDKTIVRMDATKASGSVIKVNNDDFSTGDKQTVYMEQSINLEYPVPVGYAFSGWKIAVVSPDYNVVPADFVKDGEIKVTKNGVEYCKLSINTDSPEKAVFTSIEAIGNGDEAALSISSRDVLLPKIETFSPGAGLNKKDSEIKITFNKELADNCSSLLEKIKIAMDGNNVDSFFEDRSLSGNTITIKNTGLLDVSGTAKKTISVTIPPVFYYVADNSNIYLAEEKSFEYKIDSSTNAQTKIRFDSSENSNKKVSVNGTETNNGANVSYNIGETVNLEYELPAGFKFAGWKVKDVPAEYTVSPATYVTSGTINVTKDSKTYFTLKVDSADSTKAVVQSLDEIKDNDESEGNASGYSLSIVAKDVVLPAITATTPNAAVNSKNSPITIKFNKTLATECSSLLSKIKISMDGTNVDSFFETRSLSEDTISIENTKLLDVTGSATKTVMVTIPANVFYYKDGNMSVYLMEEQTFDYKVDKNTLTKTKVKFDSSASNLKTIKVNEVEANNNTIETFSSGETINLEYELPSGYKFAGWKVSPVSTAYSVNNTSYVTSGTITVSKASKTYFTLKVDESNPAKAIVQIADAIGEGTGGYGIAVCTKDVVLPVVSTFTPSASVNSKDSEISIMFNKTLGSACASMLGNIKIEMDGTNVSSFFETRTLSTDGRTIKIKNSKLLSVSGNETKNVAVTIPANVFYYKDGDLKVYLPEEKTFSYKVNSSTVNKTNIRFDSSENSLQKLKVDNTDVTHGTGKSYNRGETVNLEYAVPASYKFAGWKVTPATNAYTASPSGYVTSGIITVSKNQIPYLTLTIDENNPAKAVVESFEAVENGTGDYGLSIFTRDVVLPAITATTPTATTNSKDSTITLTFNKSLATECNRSTVLNKIKITMDGNNVDSFFETRSLSEDTISIENTKLLDVTGSSTKTVTVTVPANIFYYQEDGLNVYMPEEKVFTYVVNANTTKQTKLRFYSSESSYKKLNVNGTETNNGTIGTYNMGEIVNLEYSLPSDYRFLGWKISPYSSAYSVSSTDYLTKGTITVTKGGQTYFTLKINDNDPTKATATCSYGTISGSSYGLTIMTKDTVIPKIVSITPEYKELGVKCDSPITITFNKEMDKSTLVLDDTILIPNLDGSYAPKGTGFVTIFEDIDENSWSGNKLTLKQKIGTDCSHHIRGADVADVTVKLVSTRIKDTYGFMLDSENTTYTYRINKEKETIKPIVDFVSVYSDETRSHLYTNNPPAIGYWSETQTDEYKYGDYSRNHAGGSFYYIVSGYDDDSGLKKLIIKETLTKRDSWYGQLSNSTDPNDIVETEYNLSDLNLAGTEKKYGHTYYKYTGTYEMKCPKDGFFHIEFYFVDFAGNISHSGSLHLIKDTKIDESVIKFTEFASDSAITSRIETNSGDKVTMTFDSSATDVFYTYSHSKPSPETLTYESGFDISVKWGYAEDAITNAAAKSGNQFTFTRDATKLTFVKIICKDEVNNTKEIMRIVPPRPDYDTTCKDYSEKNSDYTGRIFKFTPFSYSSLKTLASYYDAELEIYMSRQINGSSSYDVVSWNEDDSRLLTENNYYFLRPIYVLKYKDGSAWYSSINTSYRTYINLETDVTSSSSIRAFNIIPSVTTTTTSPSIPSSVHVDIEFLWSTGLCKVMIKESELDSNWNWSYKLVNYYDSDQIETFTTPTFYVSCPRAGENKYYVYFIAKQKSNGYVYTKSSGVSLSTQCVNDKFQYGTTGSNNILTLRNDVNPPSFANAVHHVEYNSIVYTTGPEDDREEMYTENGKGVIECYLAPNLNSNVADYDTYTIEELEKSSFTKITAKYSDVNNIVIPLDGINEGFYTACVVAKDSYGNKAVECFPLEHKYRLDYPYTITASGIKGTVLTATFLNYNNQSNTAHSFYYYTTSQKWIPYSYFITPGTYWAGNSNNPAYVRYNPNNSAIGLGTKWLKIVGQVNTEQSSAASFTQVDYVYTTNLTESITCNQKNVLQGLNGLQIFCDKSTLVHTFYSSEKITETANQDDILKWEMLGVETGITTNSSNFTYGSENFEEIPAGYYYTTVVHFADGTTVMSEVKQK